MRGHGHVIGFGNFDFFNRRNFDRHVFLGNDGDFVRSAVRAVDDGRLGIAQAPGNGFGGMSDG